MTNEELVAFRKKHFTASVLHYYKNPLQLVRAKGQYVFDEAGKQYLDFFGGIVTISAGHNHPKIKETLLKMLSEDEIQHTTVFYLNRHAVELAKTLLEDAPQGISRVFFTNSGSEANELAFLAARQSTGESTIVHLRHSYHGGTSGAQSVCGHSTWRFRAQPVTAVTSAVEPYCYRCPFGKKSDSCALECAKNVETTIQTTTNGKIAGMIVEPIMGVGGFITPPKEYFPEVAKIVHRYGGKYISDEVQTGVGRTGEELFYTKELGIDADMVTMAKGFGNGAPIGATLMKDDVSDSLAGKLFFNTFGSDPYQTAQAKATLDVINEEKLIENAKKQGEYLMKGLFDLQSRYPLIGEVRGRGLMLAMELVKNRETKEYATEETAELMELAKEKGALIGKGGLFGNVIRLTPPLNINKENCDTLLKILDESLHQMKTKGGRT